MTTLRTFAPPPVTDRHGLTERAIRWILPWTVRNYPGLRHGVVELLSGLVTYAAVRGWRSERRRLPGWAAERLADFIEARCDAGRDLVAELREYEAAYVDGRRTPKGWRIVRERNGVIRDGRYRGARKV